MIRLFGRQLRLLTRDRQLMFWNVGFFLALLLIFAGMLSGGDASVRVLVTSGIVSMSVMANALFSIAVGLAGNRERGVFRRYTLTPMARGVPVLTTIVARAVLVFAAAALLVVIARLVFGIPWSGGAASWVAILAAGSAAFAAIGFAIAAVARAPHVANTMANLVFLPMMALGGIALPPAMMPPTWAEIYWVLPVATMAEGLMGAFVGGETIVDNLSRIAYLSAWTVIAGAFGAYRWSRRAS